MRIGNDMSAVNNARMQQTTQKAQEKNMEKLSSAKKINRSSDDAAGLSISEKMIKQIEGLNKAIDNSSDGMAMTNVADGAMDEVGGMLERLNELAIKGSNGSLSADDRSAINAEANQLLADIDRVSGSTTFNEIHVMEEGNADIQSGADNTGSNRVEVSMQSMNAGTLGISGIDLSSANGSRAALTPISDAIKALSNQRSNLGAQYNRMSSTSRNLANVVENTTAANSRVKDTDMASEIMKLRKNRLLSKAQEQLAQKNREDRQAQAGALQNIQLH